MPWNWWRMEITVEFVLFFQVNIDFYLQYHEYLCMILVCLTDVYDEKQEHFDREAGLGPFLFISLAILVFLLLYLPSFVIVVIILSNVCSIILDLQIFIGHMILTNSRSHLLLQNTDSQSLSLNIIPQNRY